MDLRVKTSPPRLGAILHRERLLERIDAAVAAHSLVWIGAPGGAGKTTLAADCLARRAGRSLWYSMDAGDADPAGFFHHFGLAAKQAGIRPVPAPYTAEYRQHLDTFSRNYFGELSTHCREPMLWVFDNFQEVDEGSPLSAALSTGLRTLAPTIGVLVLSRTAPTPHFARWQACDTLHEFGWSDLRLDENECRQVLHALPGRSSLDPTRLKAIHAITDGWMSGLVLMAKGGLVEHMHDPVDPGSADPDALQRIFDYFATEILADRGSAITHFMQICAVLPSMAPNVCAELADEPGAARVLRRLGREGLFTTRRGSVKPVYQFHPLFRRFLLDGLAARVPAERKAALERRAATLLRREGEPELAAEILIRSGGWNELVDIVLEHAPRLLEQGRHRSLLDWTSALPAATREGDAWVSYWHGAALLPDDAFAAHDRFHAAYLAFREHDDARGMYYAWAGVAESLFFRHDEMRPVRFWIAELDTLRTRHPRYPNLEIRVKIGILATNVLMIAYPDHPDLPVWLGRAEQAYRFLPLKELRCFISLPLGWNYAARGRFDRLHVLARQIEPLVGSPKLSRLARLQGISCLMLSVMHCGDRRVAYRVIEEAVALAESSGIGFAQQNVYSHACINYLIWGDAERAEVMMRAFDEMTEPCHRIPCAHAHWLQGWLAALSHRFVLAKEHLSESHNIVRDLGTPFFELLATGGLAQVCTELGEMDDAWRWLCRTRALMATQRFEKALVFYGNCLESYWHLRQGNVDAALEPLERFLAVARERDWIAYTMWEPRMLSALCELALRHDIEVEHARRLIRTYALTPPDPLAVPPAWPYALHVGVLGDFRVRVGGTPLDIDGKAAARPLELLRCLVALGGRRIPQTRLIERLWPESEGDAGTRAFHTTLHRLRKLLGREELLVLKGGQLSLDERHVEVDLWALEAALDALERALRDALPTDDAAERFDAVTALYRGQLLRDDEHPWSIDSRDMLQRRVLHAALASGARAVELGDLGRAVSAHEFALEIDARHEPTYRALMQLHLRRGHFAEAMRVYERCRGVLSRTLGVLPSSDTVRLQAQIRRAADATGRTTDESEEPA